MPVVDFSEVDVIIVNHSELEGIVKTEGMSLFDKVKVSQKMNLPEGKAKLIILRVMVKIMVLQPNYTIQLEKKRI